MFTGARKKKTTKKKREIDLQLVASYLQQKKKKKKKREMDWQLVASYFTVKSTDIFEVKFVDSIPFCYLKTELDATGLI